MYSKKLKNHDKVKHESCQKHANALPQETELFSNAICMLQYPCLLIYRNF